MLSHEDGWGEESVTPRLISEEVGAGPDGRLVRGVGLAGRAGQLPAVDDHLVEGEHPGGRGGQGDAAGLSPALPGRRFTPDLGELGQLGENPLAPTVGEVTYVPVAGLWRTGRRCVLACGELQAPGEAVDVLDQVTEGVFR